MTELLKGGPVAQAIRENLIEKIAMYREKGVTVRIAILRAGEREDDLAYEKRVLSNCEKLGIAVRVLAFPQDVSQKEMEDALQSVNEDPEIHGVLLFRPLPASLNENKLARMIRPAKDIDCTNPENLNKIFQGEKDGFYPCTPEAVVEILKFYQIPMEGANISVINRSMVLGKPLAMMLMGENATVTVCHSKTRELQKITETSDIVVTGVGKANYFGKTFFSGKSVVIDVGINASESGLTGDVDFEEVKEKVKAITPVPGGVGTVTSMILLRHAVNAAERSFHE